MTPGSLARLIQRSATLHLRSYNDFRGTLSRELRHNLTIKQAVQKAIEGEPDPVRDAEFKALAPVVEMMLTRSWEEAVDWALDHANDD